MLLVGVATVAFLAVFFPYLAGVSLPHGLVGDWLIDKLAPTRQIGGGNARPYAPGPERCAAVEAILCS